MYMCKHLKCTEKKKKGYNIIVSPKPIPAGVIMVWPVPIPGLQQKLNSWKSSWTLKRRQDIEISLAQLKVMEVVQKGSPHSKKFLVGVTYWVANFLKSKARHNISEPLSVGGRGSIPPSDQNNTPSQQWGKRQNTTLGWWEVGTSPPSGTKNGNQRVGL